MFNSDAACGEGRPGNALRPVPFTAVRVDDRFWSPRLEANRETTIPLAFRKCEETGRISNFAKAGGLIDGTHEGYVYNDSDVYKLIEGAAYALSLQPDAKLDRYLDDLIAKIAAAQEPDGYLNTYFTLAAPDQKWTNLRDKHELYCAGHLFEAAVAHYQATGKRNLLNVALKLADCIDATFGPGPGKRCGVPGHEEIEIGLLRLYQLTGEERYLILAKFFLDERGKADHRKLYGQYAQDHKPVLEQAEAVGHAVRAGYLYTAMADMAMLTGQDDFLNASDTLWQDVVGRKLYITGGLGARRELEGFGAAYELPNASAYAETCAAIANALWNHRMLLLHRDARYADVLERILYNGFLSGVSMQGDRFFYPNPLAADGKAKFNQGANERVPWFGCSCCPTNVARFLPSLPGFIYAHDDESIFVNLFTAGTAEIDLPSGKVRLTQITEYPWDGHIRIEIAPERPCDFTLNIRIPGWAIGSPVPSDLYRYANPQSAQPALAVNGNRMEPAISNGYAAIKRTWQQGDSIELKLEMPIRRVLAHEHVEADKGRVALERGPIVYCVEGIDHNGHVGNLVLPDDAQLSAEPRSDLLGGVTVIRGDALAVRFEGDRQMRRTYRVPLLAVPYYAWNHRGPGEMAVWLPRKPSLIKPPPAPTIASKSRVSASHVWFDDTVEALHDQIEPESSRDGGIHRFTWWDHRGTTEWVQYDFERPERVSSVEVYWYDDTGIGYCRPPTSWRILYREGDQWKPVTGASRCSLELNRFNEVTFDPVTTTALRIEVQLQNGFSAGILEWKVR